MMHHQPCLGVPIKQYKGTRQPILNTELYGNMSLRDEFLVLIIQSSCANRRDLGHKTRVRLSGLPSRTLKGAFTKFIRIQTVGTA